MTPAENDKEATLSLEEMSDPACLPEEHAAPDYSWKLDDLPLHKSLGWLCEHRDKHKINGEKWGNIVAPLVTKSFEDSSHVLLILYQITGVRTLLSGLHSFITGTPYRMYPKDDRFAYTRAYRLVAKADLPRMIPSLLDFEIYAMLYLTEPGELTDVLEITVPPSAEEGKE